MEVLWLRLQQKWFQTAAVTATIPELFDDPGVSYDDRKNREAMVWVVSEDNVRKEHLRQAGTKTRNETTVGATERLTTEGGSQLTLRTIRMRLYKKQDLDVSK